MSEYQYYEFLAVDRPLGKADRTALRELSSRARITSTSFTNSYEWGDFRGDPMTLMERWFDLHLYFANWGTRRLMMKLPARLVDRGRIEDILGKVECVDLKPSGENLILDIRCDELETDYYWHDGEDSDRLVAIAPLRDDVLGGDLRLFYLLWLTAVEAGDVGSDEPEPMPGIGPMTGALEAFAEFFLVDADLVAAAAERSAPGAVAAPPSPDAVRRIIGEFSDHEKVELLSRLVGDDPHVAGELRSQVRRSLAAAIPAAYPSTVARTAGDLIARAEEIRRARERAEAERNAVERRRQAEQAARARRIRIDALAQRDEGDIWREIDTEIMRRNPKGYDNAAGLLADLSVLAAETGTAATFSRRLADIRERHEGKGKFIERLADLK